MEALNVEIDEDESEGSNGNWFFFLLPVLKK